MSTTRMRRLTANAAHDLRTALAIMRARQERPRADIRDRSAAQIG